MRNNDFDLLEEIRIPPAYAGRLEGSNLKKQLETMEHEQKEKENTEEPTKQNTPEGMGPESDGRTQEDVKSENATELTPLERALMERFGKENDT